MSKIFVVAGSYFQANRWIKQDIEKRINAGQTSLTLSHYVYVSSAADLRGYSDPHGVFIGTWKDRPDIQEIVETLLIQSTHVNHSLAKIRKELNNKLLAVYINGIMQAQNHDYVSDGSFVVFNQAPPPMADVTIRTMSEISKHIGNGSMVSFAIKTLRNPSQGILRGAEMLAKAIDDEVLATLCKKINGGELSGNTTSNNR
jgi:hypothetical protein